MKENTKWGIFLAVLFVFLISIHYYVLETLFSLFSIEKAAAFYPLVVFLSISYLISSYMERRVPSRFSRAFYIFSAVWLGAIFILLFIVTAYHLLNVVTPLNPLYAGIGIVALTGILVMRGIANAYSIRIKEITLHFPRKKLKKDMRIVHLSDIHIGTVNTKHFLSDVVEKANSLNPDFVALTGDLVDGSAPLTFDMVKPINEIKSPVFYCIGNHEMYDGLHTVLPILHKTKMKILRDQEVMHNGIQIAAVDFREGNKQVLPKIESLRLKKGMFTLLLNHAPTGFEEAARKGVDLQLSGHTHNGQIFPFNLFVRMAYKYITGLYKIGNSFLYVSQGTGTWGPPMRLLTQSEIVVIDIKGE